VLKRLLDGMCRRSGFRKRLHRSSAEMISRNLEMYPTQAKKRLEWATNHFILLGHLDRDEKGDGGGLLNSCFVTCAG
jgi:hypothetical protein